MNPEDKPKARVAKNVLLVTLMSLNAGDGSLIQQHQEFNHMPLEAPCLNSIISLTSEQVFSASASAVISEAKRMTLDSIMSSQSSRV